MKAFQLDKCARDARAWRNWGKVYHKCAAALFDLALDSKNPIYYFPAATLGHHALEMYLKAALICEGMTVFNPDKVPPRATDICLTKKDCAWDHKLIPLAKQLSERRTDFDLAAKLDLPDCPEVNRNRKETLRAGFELFDAFFEELRYPDELRKVEGVGEYEKQVLDRLVALLRPFSSKQTPARSRVC